LSTLFIELSWYWVTFYDTIFCYSLTLPRGHSMPNQQQQKMPTLMKFGTDMDSTKKLSHTKFGWFPFHLNFILKYHFSLHIFNKMAITLSVNVIELFHLDFWMLIKFSFRWYIITQRKRSNHKNVAFSFDVNFFKKKLF